MSRARTEFALDAAGDALEIGGSCGLFIDMARDEPAPRPGDWVATDAGSRYLVDAVRVVRRPKHTQTKRYQMSVLRLTKHTEPPVGAHVIWLTWYPRGRSR